MSQSCTIYLILLAVLPQFHCQMSFIGGAYMAFSPCPNYTLHVTHETDRPPQVENYWEGGFSLSQWPNIPEVKINMTLDAPARVVVDPQKARVNVRGKSFLITAFEHPPNIKGVFFTVYGVPGGKVPNIESIYLNGENVCPNPTPLNINIKGFSGDQESDDFGGSHVSRVDKTFGCGKRKIGHQGLITHGAETRPGDFPWHVAIYHQEGQRRTYKCGGTIINTHTILTAGHCVFEGQSLITAERIVVQVGKYHLDVADDTAREFRVFVVIPHPRYDTAIFTNDIALLRLTREMVYTDHIQPICLWPADKTNIGDIENRLATAVGWGDTENNTSSSVLRYAEIPIVPTLKCLDSDRDFFGLFLTDSNFCAGYTNGTNVCSGDSGGSLTFEDENKVWRIRGIVSLGARYIGKQICNPKHYVIFTDVAKYLPWIERVSSRKDDGRK